jgi:preprotein translocase subunit SecG
MAAVLLYVFFGLASVILILLVMIQDDQGEGLGGLFGGGSTTPFGSRSGNVLTRFTGIVSTVFFVVCLIIGLVNRSQVLGEIKQESTADVVNKTFFEPVKREALATPAPEEPAPEQPAPEQPAPPSTPAPGE